MCRATHDATTTRALSKAPCTSHELNWTGEIIPNVCIPLDSSVCPVASTRVQGWGDEPCEPTVRLPDWSELVASYSRMKSAWGWAYGGQPILVCYIRKYVIILGDIPLDVPPTKILGGCVPGIPGGVDASVRRKCYYTSRYHLERWLYYLYRTWFMTDGWK